MRFFSPPLRHIVCAALFVPAALWAQPAPVLPKAPEIAARNYLLLDVTAGKELAALEPDVQIPPASLTKLMTAYLVFDALRNQKITLEQTLPVSERAWKTPGSRMYIDPKMQVPVDDLLKGMIVQSGNDATVALAEGVGGTVEHFVQMMNDRAQALGMKDTRYQNPEGLNAEDHYTTARDLATLATRLMQDFPEHLHYYATPEYRYPGTPESNSKNRNALLQRDPTVDGLKTGYTEAAGFCLVATAKREFPHIGERRLLSIVLGTASENARANESQKLLNWGYTAFDAVKLFEADQAVAIPEIWKGTQSTLKIGQTTPLIITVPTGSVGKLVTEVVRPNPLLAPFTKGQSIGTLKVTLEGETLSETPLVALEDVAEAGFFGRAWDAVRLWWRQK